MLNTWHRKCCWHECLTDLRDITKQFCRQHCTKEIRASSIFILFCGITNGTNTFISHPAISDGCVFMICLCVNPFYFSSCHYIICRPMANADDSFCTIKIYNFKRKKIQIVFMGFYVTFELVISQFWSWIGLLLLDTPWMNHLLCYHNVQMLLWVPSPES